MRRVFAVVVLLVTMLALAPDATAAPSIVVTPADNLVDGQRVGVNGSGFVIPGRDKRVSVQQCFVTPGVYQCRPSDVYATVGPDGKFSVRRTVRRIVIAANPATDCVAGPENCFIVVFGPDLVPRYAEQLIRFKSAAPSTTTTTTAPTTTTTPSTSCPNPTINGTSGNDTLNGTSGADVIDGRAGNDTINGLGGADTICGGYGIDTINGGGANDKLIGGADNDALDGGTGTDNCNGGGGTGDTAVNCESKVGIP